MKSREILSNKYCNCVSKQEYISSFLIICLKSDTSSIRSHISWRMHHKVKLTNEGIYIIGKRFNSRKQYNSKRVQGVVQYLGSVKNLLMPGMISGCLLRTYFLRKFSLYFSPSAWLSKIPAALFSLVHLVVKFTRKKTTLEHQYNISALNFSSLLSSA